MNELGTRFIYYIKHDYKYQLEYIIKKLVHCLFFVVPVAYMHTWLNLCF